MWLTYALRVINDFLYHLQWYIVFAGVVLYGK